MEIQKVFATILTTLAASALCFSQTTVEVQEVKELKPTGSLSTCGYRTTDREKAFLEKLPSSERVTGSFMDKHDYRIRGKVKLYVSWFGVVRGSSPLKSDDRSHNLLIQQKYFDGMTDCHIMLVSNAGAGDFVANLVSSSEAVPLLSLVRVYGTVLGEDHGIPQVSADYVRVWPWFTFTFTDLGPETTAIRNGPNTAKSAKGAGSTIHILARITT